MPEPPAPMPSYGTFAAPTDLLDYQGGDTPPAPGQPFSCQIGGVFGVSADGQTVAVIKSIDGMEMPPQPGVDLDGDLGPEDLETLAGAADANMGRGPAAGNGY